MFDSNIHSFFQHLLSDYYMYGCVCVCVYVGNMVVGAEVREKRSLRNLLIY